MIFYYIMGRGAFASGIPFLARFLQKLFHFPYERSELFLFFLPKIYYYNPGTDGVVE